MHEVSDQISLKLGDDEYGKAVLKWSVEMVFYILLLFNVVTET